MCHLGIRTMNLSTKTRYANAWTLSSWKCKWVESFVRGLKKHRSVWAVVDTDDSPVECAQLLSYTHLLRHTSLHKREDCVWSLVLFGFRSLSYDPSCSHRSESQRYTFWKSLGCVVKHPRVNGTVKSTRLYWLNVQYTRTTQRVLYELFVLRWLLNGKRVINTHSLEENGMRITCGSRLFLYRTTNDSQSSFSHFFGCFWPR